MDIGDEDWDESLESAMLILVVIFLNLVATGTYFMADFMFLTFPVQFCPFMPRFIE